MTAVTKIRPTASPSLAAPGDPARAALRKAIAERDAAKIAFDRAVAAEKRGKGLVETAEERLAAFGNVDGAISLYRADQVKQSVMSGGGDQPSMELPTKLVERRRALDEARTRLDAASAAHEALSAEAETAKQALLVCEREVSLAAITIMNREAEVMALELARVAAWERILTNRLRSLASVWLPVCQGERPRCFQLSPDVLYVLENGAAALRLPPGESVDPHAQWRKFYDRLLVDAEAAFGAR